MSGTLWGHRPPPPDGADLPGAWEWELGTSADVTLARGELRERVTAPSGRLVLREDDVQRLLLSFEELASNGVRHGRAPVRAAVRRTRSGWLIEVTDASVDRPPTPAVGRDAADGGLGLYLVARLSAAHGWTVRGARKHVWALVDRAGARSRGSVPAGGRKSDRG